MTRNAKLATALEAAVTVIDDVAIAVENADGGIDGVQIAELRLAIDRLEMALNKKKRVLDAGSED